MKLLMLCMVLMCGGLADKEVSEEYANLLTEKLIQEIEKRLMEWDSAETDGLDDSQEQVATLDGGSCSYQVAEDAIIRTEESLAAGAKFLRSISDDTVSRVSCQRACCEEKTCNLAVLKSKGDELMCYIFDCGNPSVCNFSRHDGFASMSVSNRVLPSKHEDHEEALEQLVPQPETTSMTSTTTITTAAFPAKQELVPLYGVCASSNDCAGQGTVCLADHCVCATGHHEQEGVCREDCHKFQFQCLNAGDPLATPQCVAVYDACDRIQHCQDGSDEMNCEAPTTTDYNRGSSTSRGKGSGSGRGSGRGDTRYNTPSRFGGTNSRPYKHPGGYVSKEDHYNWKHNTDAPSSATPDIPSTSTTEPPVVESNMESNTPDNEPPAPDIVVQPKEEDSENPTAPPEEVNKKINVIVPEEPPSGQNQIVQDTVTTQSILSLGNDTNAIIIETGNAEELVVFEEAGTLVYRRQLTNKTAVLVLAMGLSITAILLIFVGCRLRNVKRRLRRGRPLNSNEADYLINGMYL